MQKCDLWEYEQVVICNVNNGNRWETLRAARRLRIRHHRGAGTGGRACASRATSSSSLAYEVTDEPAEPRQILVDENNRFVDYLRTKYEQPV